jgi:uncharacterized membrane protein
MGPLRLFVKSTHGPERLSALTDGVYAIALTLLVLDLKAPDLPGVSDRQLTDDLLRQGPNFAAYLISFAAVSYFWIQHHRVFGTIRRCDDLTVLGNFVHLLFISLTPYTASLIGLYQGDRVATIVFSLNFGLASLLGTMLAGYLSKQGDWHVGEADGKWAMVPWWGAYFAPLIAVASILVSLVNTQAALALWLLLPVRDILVRRRLS